MQKQQKEFFNLLIERWDYHRSLDQNKIAKMVSLIGFGRNDAVLNLGCGCGILIPLLRIRNCGHITNIDSSARIMERAREKYGHISCVTFLTRDIWEYKPEKPFDKILCLNMFSHIIDKAALIKHLISLLNPGGSLAIMHDLSRVEVNAKYRNRQTGTVERLPQGKQLARILNSAGYQVEMVLDNRELYFLKAVKPSQDRVSMNC